MCFDEPIKLVFPCFGKERPLKQSKKLGDMLMLNSVDHVMKF